MREAIAVDGEHEPWGQRRALGAGHEEAKRCGSLERLSSGDQHPDKRSAGSWEPC
jgi:hypothetical protein